MRAENTTDGPGVALPGDIAIPQLGLGTWQLRGGDCRSVVRQALELGYRHVDTAEGYDNEEEVGRGIRDAGIDRSSLWITSKVWRQHLQPDDLRSSCQASLRRLGTDYLDLLLIHWPNSDIPIARTIDGFRSLRDDGMIRAWGVSNFTPTHMRETVDVETPATNQVELHPYFNQQELVKACRELRVPLTAYTPLAKGRVMDDPVLREIGDEHGASPAQIALAWSLEHGHVVIPKASSEAHLRANLESLEIRLSRDQMQRIDRRPQGDRLVDGDWSEFDR